MRRTSIGHGLLHTLSLDAGAGTLKYVIAERGLDCRMPGPVDA